MHMGVKSTAPPPEEQPERYTLRDINEIFIAHHWLEPQCWDCPSLWDWARELDSAFEVGHVYDERGYLTAITLKDLPNED